MLSEAQAAAIWRRAAQWQAEAASRLERESAEASRPVEGPNPSSGYGARDVPQALGRALQGHPYNLVLADQLGGHPLDGGILVFEFSGGVNMTGAGGAGPFTQVRWGTYARPLRATLRPVSSDGRSTEVTLHIDLRLGLTANVWGSGAMGATGSIMGGAAWAAALLGDALSILPPPPPAETTRQTR